MKKILAILLLLLLFSCQKNKIVAKTNLFYDKAYELNSGGKTDSAYVYYDKAEDVFRLHKDSVGMGKCIVNKAIILTDKGDYYAGQELSLKAQQFFDKNDKDQYAYICANYNNLGIASNNVKDFPNAIKYYDLAVKYADSIDNKLTYLKNKANTYKDEKKYSEAIKIYESILPQIKNTNKKLYARLLSNLENVKSLNNPNYNPEPQLLQAIEIEKQINDKWAQNAGYAHLSDYYIINDRKKALLYAENMYQIAREIKSPTDRLEALQKLVLLDPEKSVKNFQTYLSLNDSIQREKDKNDSKFAFIRFDVEKIKRQNAEKEVELLYKNAGIGALILVLVGGIFWFRKRQKRLQQEKELEVKNTQLKMSKKVHDVVANGIYQVMTKIENQPDFDKEGALDELEFVYEKSRDISYEKEYSSDILEFDKKISNLIGSFKNDEVNTFLAGNGQNIWANVSHTTKDEVYQVLRELLVNMKKHSQATLVAFKFERDNNLIQIHYTDNGIGVPGDISYNNGLTNTVSRIEKIHGEITFDTQTEKGLKIHISFPAF
ncbi:tetratricopeptide repeat-containing sensor histidine kinase [Chryseobacterium sp.]|uniref:tetratricopeptide repeat-containing sensor histidine kinase n=1 Tax=Chryseobacterium sp. TaxID=1871047 RepID=UPI0026018642|nr:tetratricopeptide repeat-containing sensor histidine kinase [Chryseobacterium sp.]